MQLKFMLLHVRIFTIFKLSSKIILFEAYLKSNAASTARFFFGKYLYKYQFRISPHRPNVILGIENRVKKGLFP